MMKLACTFPCLRRAIAASSLPVGWDANTVDRWACVASHGERAAAQFLLAVWDQDHEWQCGRFDFMDALRIFDESHRAALLEWAADPWWP